MKILVFDPSGNYFEGKGTSGWALYYENKLTSVGQLQASDYDNRYEYWKAHIDLIKAVEPDYVVLENFVLYAHTKEAQINSEFETSQLIGVIKFYCDCNNIEWYVQHARIKPRFSNEILLRKNIITQKSANSRYYAVGIPVSGHIIDAIRHGEYFINFVLHKLKEKRKL